MAILSSVLNRKSPPPQGERRAVLPSLDRATNSAAPGPARKLGLGALALAGVSLLGACQQQTPVEPPPELAECALIVVDSFTGTSHGHTVRSTAESLGDIAVIGQYDQHAHPDSREDLPFRRVQREFGRSFSQAPLSAEDASEALDGFFRESTVQWMDMIGSIVDDAQQRQVQNSALNISLGLNQLYLSDFAQSHIQSGSELSQTQKEVYRENLHRALGLDSQAGSRDLQQALFDRSSAVLESEPSVLNARERWSSTVSNFESRFNSIAVSAGNHGGRVRELRSEGYLLSDFADSNVLAVPDVTVVGSASQGAVASYSRTGPEVDIYAPGSRGLSQGTSIASPHTAAALRAVHCANPGTPSDDAEAFVKENLSRGYRPEASELSLDAVKGYIADKAV